jgi:hypothetical protein
VSVAGLVERFSRNLKVFLSSDHRKEQPSKPKTLHEQVSLQRQFVATEEQTVQLVYGLCVLTEQEIGTVSGGAK